MKETTIKRLIVVFFCTIFLGECIMGLLYRLGICSRQLCLYPGAMEYLRLFMHFSGLFQSGGQIAGEARQTSNNCFYRVLNDH